MIYIAGTFFMLVSKYKNSRDWADITEQSLWISMLCAEEINDRNCDLARNKIIKFFKNVKLFGPYIASGWVVSRLSLSSLRVWSQSSTATVHAKGLKGKSWWRRWPA